MIFPALRFATLLPTLFFPILSKSPRYLAVLYRIVLIFEIFIFLNEKYRISSAIDALITDSKVDVTQSPGDAETVVRSPPPKPSEHLVEAHCARNHIPYETWCDISADRRRVVLWDWLGQE